MNIVWLSLKEGTPGRGYWDQRLLEEFFIEEKHIEANSIPNLEDMIVVIPGAYQAEYAEEIKTQLLRIKDCKVIITSDEENKFPIDELDLPNVRVFATYYNKKYKGDITWLPIGPANVFDIPLPDKTNDFVFAGQVTHPARENFIKEVRKAGINGFLLETDGFAQGDKPEDYFRLLSTSKVAPSPAGNISPDAFRTYEAICAGAVPIATSPEFHEAVFGSVPFPVIESFGQVEGYMKDAIALYPRLNNEVQAWWLKYKRSMKRQLLGEKRGDVTVVIPCSPIKSHPSIKVIAETIRTVREHLPYAEIIVTFDGVRSEQEDRRADYEEFKRRFLWECYHNKKFSNILSLIFDEHMHQVKMAREALKFVESDNVLYVEQDTPLTPDYEIDWDKCFEFLASGEANVIRFHFEAFVPEEHKHLMIGEVENGFLKTYQWSQRPHLITTAYFDSILQKNFTEDAVCFIEDKMHGVVQDEVSRFGLNGWYQHRIWIYHPEGSIKRSYHLDGREGEAKWDNTQTW